MKIALVQMDIEDGVQEVNLKTARSFGENAKAKNLDLLVFPEMFSTGYTMNSKKYEEELGTGPSSALLREIAQSNGCNVLGGVIEKTTEKAKNSALIYDEKGNLVYKFSKRFLPSFTDENIHYQPGVEMPVLEFKDQKIAVCICYEIRFPELFRTFVDRGATCIIVIASWSSPRAEHWKTLLKARAIENQVYIVGVNRVGIGESEEADCMNQDEFLGQSMVIDPFGNIIASTEEGKEDLIVADLDVEKVNDLRKSFPVLDDRASGT